MEFAYYERLSQRSRQNSSFFSNLPPDDANMEAANIVLTIEFVLAILGVIFNIGGFFLFLHPSIRKLASVPHLMSIAVGDILFLVFGVILVTVKFIAGTYLPGPGSICAVRVFIGNVASMASRYGLALFSILRACIACSPLRMKAWFGRFHNVTAIIILWTISIAIFFPVFFTRQFGEDCVFEGDWLWIIEYFSWLQVGTRAILNIILITTNVIIVIKMRTFASRFPADNSLGVNTSEKIFRKVTYMSVKLSVFQLATTVPGGIIWTCLTFRHQFDYFSSTWILVMNCLYLLNTLNHSGNAMFYVTLSDTLHRDIFQSCCRRRTTDAR